MVDFEYEQILAKIQIRKNYVVHLSYPDDIIVSAFDCDISATFKLIRTYTVLFTFTLG